MAAESSGGGEGRVDGGEGGVGGGEVVVGAGRGGVVAELDEFEDHDMLRCATQKLVIPAGSGFTVPIPVAGGERVKFSFTTQDYDVIFGVSRVDAEGVRTVVEPPRRVPSHERPIRGEVDVPRGVRGAKPQALLVEFDNNFSWFTDKQLTLSIEVHLPPGRFEGIYVEHLEQARSRLAESRRAQSEFASVLSRASSELSEAEAALAAAQRRRAEAAATVRRARELDREAGAGAALARAEHAGRVWEVMGPRARALVVLFAGPACAVEWRAVSRRFLAGNGDEGVWARAGMEFLVDAGDEEGRREVLREAIVTAGVGADVQAAARPPTVRKDPKKGVHWNIAPYTPSHHAKRVRDAVLDAIRRVYGPATEEEDRKSTEKETKPTPDPQSSTKPAPTDEEGHE